MEKLTKKFDNFARKHKLFWFDEVLWGSLNKFSWDNRFRIKYLNRLNKHNPIFKLGEIILNKIGCHS